MRDGSGDRLHASYAMPAQVGPDGARMTIVRRPRPRRLRGLDLHGAATRAVLEAGHPVLRLNLRGAGPSRALCANQYHAGRSQDLADAFAGLPKALVGDGLAVVGFSLGGNVLAEYLAEQGAGGPVRAAVMVSSPLDLATALASMTRRRNRVYHNYLLSRLQIQSALPDSRCDAETRAVMARALDLRYRPGPDRAAQRLRRRRGLLCALLGGALPAGGACAYPGDPRARRSVDPGRRLPGLRLARQSGARAAAVAPGRPSRLPRPRQCDALAPACRARVPRRGWRGAAGGTGRPPQPLPPAGASAGPARLRRPAAVAQPPAHAAYASCCRDLQREIRQHAVGAGALEAEQRLEHRLAVEPAVLGGAFSIAYSPDT